MTLLAEGFGFSKPFITMTSFFPSDANQILINRITNMVDMKF